MMSKLQLSHLEEGRHEVGSAHRFVAYFSLGEALGHADDQRAADGAVIGGEFHLESLLPPSNSLVRPEDDQGVVVLAGVL